MNSKKNIREEFVAFLSCNYGLTGEGLFQTIKEYLGKVDLDIANCRGQGYDSAGAVSGKNNRLAT